MLWDVPLFKPSVIETAICREGEEWKNEDTIFEASTTLPRQSPSDAKILDTISTFDSDSRDTAGSEFCGEVHLSTTLTEGGTEITITAPTPIIEELRSARHITIHKRAGCPAHDSNKWTETTRSKRSCIIRWIIHLLHIFIGIFYTLIPPWPSLVLKKVVFRAPPKGFYYFLVGESVDNEENNLRVFHSASDAHGAKNLRLCIPQLAKPIIKAPDVYFHLARSKAILIEFDPKKFICALELYCLETVVNEKRLRNLYGPALDTQPYPPFPSQRRVKSPHLIIFSQPNSSDLGCMLMMEPNCADIADFLHCDMLIFEYPGYGVSDGSASESSIYKAIEAVFKYAVNVMKYDPKDIILLGFSLGTAAITHIASEVEVGALVLIAPFTSFLRIITRCPRARKRFFDMFPSYDKAITVKCPALICHGKRDILISHSHGLAIAGAIKDSEIFLMDGSGHQGIFCERKVWDKVRSFLFARLHIDRKWRQLAKQTIEELLETQIKIPTIQLSMDESETSTVL